MSSARIVLKTLLEVRAIPGRNDKLAALKKLLGKPSGKLLERIATYACHPHWTYGVTSDKLPLPSNKPALFDDTCALERLFELLEALRDRADNTRLLGAELNSLFQSGGYLGQDLFKGILDRDLRIGFKDWNKLFPGMIPESPIMLCEPWDGKPLKGDWIAEPKFDGVRAAIQVDATGECTLLSRNGKPLNNWGSIAAAIKGAPKTWGYTLDGELYYNNFNTTMSIVTSKKPHADAVKLQFHAFDMVTPAEWIGQAKKPRDLETRQKALWAALVPGPNLCRVPHQLVETLEDIADQADIRYRQGYEGIVLKRLASIYVPDRSDDWQKIKPEADADLTITKVCRGANKNEGTMGYVVAEGCVQYKKKQYAVVTRVGGGWSASERDWVWQHKKQVIGKVIEVRFQDVTSVTTLGKTVPSLRFPRFKRFRADR